MTHDDGYETASCKAHLTLAPSARLKADAAARAASVRFERQVEVTTRGGGWPLEGEALQHLWVWGDGAAVEKVVADVATLPSLSEPHLHVHGILTLAVAATRVCGPHPARVRELTGQWLEGDETAKALIDTTDHDAAFAMMVRATYIRDGVAWARAFGRADWVPDYRHPLADGTWQTGDEGYAIRLIQSVPVALYPEEARSR